MKNSTSAEYDPLEIKQEIKPSYKLGNLLDKHEIK